MIYKIVFFFFTSNLYFLTLKYIYESNISVIIVAAFWYLVSLRIEILLSRNALVKIGLTIFPSALIPHIYSKLWAVNQTSGISVDSSAAKSSLRSFSGVTAGSIFLTWESNQLPADSVLTHLKRQWGRSARGAFEQSLQFSEELGRILASLASDGRILFNNFHKKLVASLQRPLSLARLQVVSQSVEGDASSALDLMNSLVLSGASSMVMLSSTNTLYHWATDIVITSKGVLSLTFLIIEKKSRE